MRESATTVGYDAKHFPELFQLEGDHAPTRAALGVLSFDRDSIGAAVTAPQTRHRNDDPFEWRTSR
jgi:hypothetical protein